MDPMLARAIVVLALVVAVITAGRLVRRRDGAVRADGHTRFEPEHLDAVGLDLSNSAAGAVLIGSPTCAPCESAKQVLGGLARERAGFEWVYADAADHLDLTGTYRIMRVPTVLLLAADGRILARTSGVPREDELRRALDVAAA